MSQVLYRKYRPEKWNDVIGQDHVVSVLKSSSENKKISHAYLFTGGRGTGKTTIARIFAKSLGISPSDIYEIDAASNRGIDDIREIRDGVHVLPLNSEYKAYIIDEVHMLTKEAFNALLKTLEEPPAHAIFILATTETDKIPETVISRCQVFNFKKPNQNTLKETITNVAKKEGFSIDQSASDLISILAEGSFRDALGLLQKVIGASENKKINLKDVEDITGAPKSTLVFSFVEALVKGDKEKAISSILNAKKENISMKIFIALILEKARLVILLSNANITESIKKEVGEDEYNKIQELSSIKDSKLKASTLIELLKAYDMVGRSYIESLPLELLAIELK
jgi:DNA polymerase-3 subunit gamma/tau